MKLCYCLFYFSVFNKEQYNSPYLKIKTTTPFFNCLIGSLIKEALKKSKHEIAISNLTYRKNYAKKFDAPFKQRIYVISNISVVM